MKVYKRKTLTKMFIVSAVLALVCMIAMVILNGGLNGLGGSAGMALIILIIALPFIPFEVMGFLLNWKKILIGFVAPIPIISYLKQWMINGTICAVKALIVIIKKKDHLVVCDGKAVIDGIVEYEEEEQEEENA